MITPTRARVLLADDHRLVAEALKGLLSEEFDLVGVVEDGLAMVDAVGRLQPDVVVADISMPHLSGIEALPRIKAASAATKVVFLTMHNDVAYARRALEAGAAGFVLKHSAPEELILAVRSALQGRTFITPVLAGQVIESMKHGAPIGDPAASLSPRQREILCLLTAGLSAKQIALKLDISHRTVEFHKYQAMEALGIKSNAELIHFAIKHGIVP
jgi:DNA-binding NarL/FixJ family response regulator